MWKVYKANHYIQGELISKHKTEAAARKKANEEIKFSYTVKEESKKEIVIWLENKDRTAVGIIVKSKKKGT
tara:strand:- start:92 stop:304 length:213 start_codon:yes stop_codon:yes gene_type:complete